MMGLGRAAAAAAALTVSMAAGAGTAPAQTIEETLAQAYVYSADLAAFRARLRATDEGVAVAMSGWRPTLTFSANVGEGFRESKGGLSTGTGNGSFHLEPRGESLTLAQNLYRGGRTVAAVRQADYLVQSDRAAMLDLEQQVLLQAATAYMDVVRDQAVLELNENNEKVLMRQLEATRDRFQVGEVTRTDVAQSESRLAAAKAARVAAEGTLANSRATYVRLVGQAPATLKPAQPLGGLPANVTEASALAAEKAFLVQAARYVELAARENVDVIFGEMLPLVTLNGSLADSRDTTTPTGRQKTGTISVIATVPLYEAGSVQARTRQAKEVAAQRKKEVDRQVRLSVQTATQAWDALLSARAQVISFQAQVNAAQIALNGVQQEQQVGSRTVLDVLDAEQELLNAQVNLVRAQHDVVVQTYVVRAAVSALTASQLALPVAYTDVEKHYNETRHKFFGWWTTGESDDK
jgi:outer membrane protein/adhesin transport system outer membrane protein